MDRLTNCSGLAGLRRLCLFMHAPEPQAFRALLNSPHLRQLRWLEIQPGAEAPGHPRPAGQPARARGRRLESWPRLKRLARIDLRGRDVSDQEAERIQALVER